MLRRFCGPTVTIVFSNSEIHPAQVFVAVLGASNYTYAEATLTQSLPDWLGRHVRTRNRSQKQYESTFLY